MLTRIWSKHVRNLQECVVDISQHQHLYIHGHNNQGKTNFLESIHLGLTGRSPIESDLSKSICFAQPEALIGMDIIHTDAIFRIYTKYTNKNKKYFLCNNRTLKTASPLQTICNPFYISAEIIQLFTESPGTRRHCIDHFLSRETRDYKSNLANYQKSLRQKNELLKQKQNSPELLIWNQKLATHGARIIDARIKYLNQLRTLLTHTINLLFPDILPAPEIRYGLEGIETKASEAHTESSLYTLLINRYTASVEREITAGHTLYGPHRDDFSIYLNNSELYFASKGIKRLLAILFTLEQIQKLNVPPHTRVLLLDDTFAEIDEINKQRVLDHLSRHFQLIYTTTTPHDLKYFPAPTLLREIQKGALING